VRLKHLSTASFRYGAMKKANGGAQRTTASHLPTEVPAPAPARASPATDDWVD